MFDPSYSKTRTQNFFGSWSAMEETDVPPNRAVYCQNVQFQNGRVSTRFGFDATFQPSDIVSSMFNWVYADPSTGAKNWLMWFASSPSAKMRYADLASPTPTDVYSQVGAVGAVVASAGSRLVTANYGSNGLGVGHGRILFFSGGVLMANTLFARPMLTTEVTLSSSVSAGGNCTPGTRKIAFILETRDGFIGRYSPATNDANLTVSPLSLTTTAANKQATITLTPSSIWPSNSARVRLIATKTSNPASWYFVPGAVATVAPATVTPASITFNISDQDLAIAANSADKYQFLVTQSNTGSAPFSPLSVFEAGNRMAYLLNDSNYGQGVFFSDENNYQALNTAYSLYYLPGQRQVTAGFVIGGVIYLLGPNWTYGVQDTGGYPSNWPAAREIDLAIGATHQKNVAVNVALGTAWVASKAGLFRFSGGRYDRLPVSWYNAEYSRINWSYGQSVEVVDDALNKKVRVIAPLDLSTTPNAILTWDYTNGTDVDKVSFSYDYLATGQVFNSAAVVQNASTQKLEFWLGPGAVDQGFRREKTAVDTNPYRDEDEGIPSLYRTGPQIGQGHPRLSTYTGATFRARGNGDLSIIAKSLDNQVQFSATSITLSSTPGVEYDRIMDLIAEDVKLELSNGGALDAYFDVSTITNNFTPFSEQR